MRKRDYVYCLTGLGQSDSIHGGFAVRRLRYVSIVHHLSLPTLLILRRNSERAIFTY